MALTLFSVQKHPATPLHNYRITSSSKVLDVDIYLILSARSSCLRLCIQPEWLPQVPFGQVFTPNDTGKMVMKSSMVQRVNNT